MAIKFACACGHRMGAPEAYAGKRAKCPACGEVLEIPAVPAPPPPIRPPSRTPTDYNIRAVDDHIRFHCEHCGRRIGVPLSFAGRRGRCPGCNEAVQVPLASPAVPPAKAPTRTKTDYGMRAVEDVPAVARTLQKEKGGAADAAKPCPSCGNSVTAGQRFCGACGASVEKAATTVSRAAGIPSSAPQADRKIVRVGRDKMDPSIAENKGAFGALVALSLAILVMGVAPLFRVVDIGAGGFTGLSGWGKYQLVAVVIVGATLALATVRRRHLRPTVSAAACLSALVAAWMGRGVYQLSNSARPDASVLEAMLQSQITPGVGAYLGLFAGIAGALAACALLYLLARLQASKGGKPRSVEWVVALTQTVGIAAGILVSVLGQRMSESGPDAGAPGDKIKLNFGGNVRPLDGGTRDAEHTPAVELGASAKVGGAEFTPLDVSLRKVRGTKSGVGGAEPIDTEHPCLVLRVRIKNTTAGEVFGPLDYVRSGGVGGVGSEVRDNFGNKMRQYMWFGDSHYEFDGQDFRDLKPGETLTSILVNDPPAVGNATRFDWTVSLRTSNKYDMANVVVHFDAARIAVEKAPTPQPAPTATEAPTSEGTPLPSDASPPGSASGGEAPSSGEGGPPPLGGERVVTLGQTVRLGDVEITPVRVNMGRVAGSKVDWDKSRTRVESEDEKLGLTLRIRNVSKGACFAPVTEETLRACRVMDNFKNVMAPFAEGAFEAHDYELDGQRMDELKPGQEMETAVYSEKPKVDNADSFVWIVYVISGNQMSFSEFSPPDDLAIQVRFGRSDIAQGNGSPLVEAPPQQDPEGGRAGMDASDPLWAELNRPVAPLPAAAFLVRTEGKQNAIRAGGGSEKTERAVSAALGWLARHQSPDGSWSAADFHQQCIGASCGGPGYADYDAGVTGLALLAFLGAGYTHLSSEELKDPVTQQAYKPGEAVKRAIRWLVSNQGPDGCVGPRVPKMMYNDAICAEALAEAYGMTGTEALRAPAQRAIDFLARARNPGMAWRYTPRCGENDASVTGWCVMALKSAEMAKLEVDRSALVEARNFLNSATDRTWGKCGYTSLDDAGVKVVVPGKNEDYTPHEALTAIATAVRVFVMHDRRASVLEKGAKLLALDLPAWDRVRKTNDYYYWYYGTLALFQFDGPGSGGGGNYWRPWNAAVAGALVRNQNQMVKDAVCAAGSWDADDRWGFEGGRVYATAIGALTLETCYRFRSVFDRSARNLGGNRVDGGIEPACETCDGTGRVPCANPGCDQGQVTEVCPDCRGVVGPTKCLHCDGTGFVLGNDFETMRCGECHGCGTLVCEKCKGTGKVTKRCPDCKGNSALACPDCGGAGKTPTAGSIAADAAENALNRAKNFQKNRMIDEAIEQYKEIVSTYPNTNAAKEAQRRLDELQAAGGAGR